MFEDKLYRVKLGALETVLIVLFLAANALAIIFGYFVFYIVRGFDYYFVLVAFATTAFLFALLCKTLFPMNKALSDLVYYSLGIVAVVSATNSEVTDRRAGETYWAATLTDFTFGNYLTDISVAERFWNEYNTNKSDLINSARAHALERASVQTNEFNKNNCRYSDIRRDIVSIRAEVKNTGADTLNAIEMEEQKLRNFCLQLDFAALENAYQTFLNGDDTAFDVVFYFLSSGVSDLLSADQDFFPSNGAWEKRWLAYLLIDDDFALLNEVDAKNRIRELRGLINGTFGRENIDVTNEESIDESSLAFVSMAGWLPFVIVSLLCLKIASGKSRSNTP